MMRKLMLIGCLLLLALSGGAAAQDDPDVRAYELRWSPDGRWISVGSTDGAWVFDTHDFAAAPAHYRVGGGVYTVAFDPVRPHVAFASGGRETVYIVNMITGDFIFVTSARPAAPDPFSVFYDIDYSSDGKYLAVTNTAKVYILDAATGDEIFDWYVPIVGSEASSQGWVTAAEFTSDNTALAVVHRDLLVAPILDPYDATYQELDFKYRPVNLKLIHGTENMLLLSYYEPASTIYLHENMSGEKAEPLPGLEDIALYGFDVHQAKGLVAAGSAEEWLLYDLNTSTILQTFTSSFREGEIEPRIYSLAFNPEGTQVATLQTDGQLQIWDVASGEVIATLGSFKSGFSQRWG
jgi:WD40 repeat protein